MTKGRKKKPTKSKELEGNPGRRKLGTEPEPSGLKTGCPEWLSDVAKEEWGRVAPELMACGLLTELDMAALAGYCTCFARWKESELRLRATGTAVTTMTDAKGIEKRHPMVINAEKALAQMNTFLAQFGMSPTARANLATFDDNDDSEMAGLIDR